jgi:two-component system sensor histidine kinase HydH
VSRTASSRALSLRSKFLLTVLAGAVVPLGLIGLWLTYSAGRAGEELLRAQMGESLDRLAEEVRGRWAYRQSDLLLLAGNEAVQRALRQDGSQRVEADDSALLYLHEAYADMQESIDMALYRDASGRARWTLAMDPAAVPHFQSAETTQLEAASASPGFTTTLEILDNHTGKHLGTLDARVRMNSLLPARAEQTGPGGMLLTVLDRKTGAPLLPTPLDPGLLTRESFDSGGERWTTVRREIDAPPLELVMAAPLGPYTKPFQRTARQGAWALLAVALAGFLLAMLLTRRLTYSLERLAEAADAVAHGELDRKVGATAGDEVGRLAAAFNTMTESLRRTLHELSQRQALAAVGEFASILAHEVRNPLTSIRIDLQRVEEKLPEDAAIRRPLTRALGEIKRLDHTVSGALRIARSGRVTLEPLELRQLLQGTIYGAEPEFSARGASIEALPATDSLWLRGDASALAQLFLNLLLNAAQALDAGGRAGITVERSGGHALVSVWDTGPGIPPEDLERIFEPFYSTKSDGTGLGLPVAQRIAAAHGGTVEVRSTPGEGTTVRVRLPLAPTATEGR